MPRLVKSYAEIKIGDLYEDCFYHPCYCVKIDVDGDEVSGISLIDGSFPRCCSVEHCGIRLLSLEEAIIWKHQGPQDVEPNAIEVKWWTK